MRSSLSIMLIQLSTLLLAPGCASVIPPGKVSDVTVTKDAIELRLFRLDSAVDIELHRISEELDGSRTMQPVMAQSFSIDAISASGTVLWRIPRPSLESGLYRAKWVFSLPDGERSQQTCHFLYDSEASPSGSPGTVAP